MNAGNLSPQLRRKMRPVAAFVALGDESLRAVFARMDSLLHHDDPDPEAVHELRVAVRHLRAVAWSFGPALEPAVKARWKQALHDVADAASETRDWDVFIAETLTPALAREPGHATLLALLETAQARREAARAQMMTRLSSYRQAPLPTLHRDLLHLAGPAGHAHGRRQGRLGTFAASRIRKARKHVRDLARIARDGKTEHVHRLRIGNKRLRYAIEALAEVLPRRYRKRLLNKLVKRQTSLGEIVDSAVARRLMAECLNAP